MIRILATLLACLSLSLPASAAEEKDPEFLKNFFGPELVLQHASAIGLTKDQRSALTKDIGRVTGATTELQLSMIEHLGELEALSAADPIDEQALVAAIHQVLLAENQVKEAHMGLLARIRNLLTTEQREKLRKLRDGG